MSTFASRILPHLHNPEGVGYLIKKSNVSTEGEPLAAPVPAAVAMSMYKGAVGKVVSIASDPRTDASVLAKYAGDTRVSVRHALLVNRNLPYAAAVKLGEWLHTRVGDEVLSAALKVTFNGASHPGFAPVDLIRMLRMVTKGDQHFYPYAQVAELLYEHGTRDEILEAWSLEQHTNLRHQLLLAAYLERGAVPFSELLGDGLGRGVAAAVVYTAGRVPHLNMELARALVAACSPKHSVYIHSFRWETMDDGCAEELLASRNPKLLAAVVSSGYRGPALAPALAAANNAGVANVLALGGETVCTLTSEQFVALAAAACTEDSLGNLTRLMERGSLPLPWEVLDRMFRVGGLETLSTWINGRFPNQHPRKGEVRLVGKHLSDYLKAVSLRRYGQPTDEAQARSYLLQVATDHLRVAGVDSWFGEELLEVFDAQMLQVSRYGESRQWQLISFDIERRINGRVSLLDTIAMLAEEWEGGLDGLIQAAGRLEGVSVERPKAMETEFAQEANGQLVLL